jgi:hypothetical protein
MGLRILMAAGLLAAGAAAATITFDTDPFQGTTARTTPGRQIIANELFTTFDTATDNYALDSSVFGVNQINFANAAIDAVPHTGINTVVLETTDNDNNPATPFAAGNAADLLAGQITDHGPGFFVYFNSALNVARLVYSTDLSDNTADLKILARMTNLTGQAGIDALPTFSAANFNAVSAQASVPEPSDLVMMSAAAALWAFSAALRRYRTKRAGLRQDI